MCKDDWNMAYSCQKEATMKHEYFRKSWRCFLKKFKINFSKNIQILNKKIISNLKSPSCFGCKYSSEDGETKWFVFGLPFE